MKKYKNIDVSVTPANLFLQIKSIIKANQHLSQFFNQAVVDIAVNFILRIYSFIFMGFCLIPFVFLTFEKYWVVLEHINYSGLILFGLYPVIWGPILRAIVVDKKRD